MPLCKGIHEKGKKRGKPCGKNLKTGDDFCQWHQHQRPLTPEEEARKAVALKAVAWMEAELIQRIPPRAAASYMDALRKRVAQRPDVVAMLVETDGLPEAQRSARLLAWVGWLEQQWNRSAAPLHLTEENPDTAQPARKGERLLARHPDLFRAMTALPVKDVLSMLFCSKVWQQEEANVRAEHGETQLHIACEPAIGFTPEYAIQQIARSGPAVAQTLLAMVGLWAERNAGKPRETYLETYASDLLRYMGRVENGDGGYDSEEVLAQGRHISLLKRITVPKARQDVYPGNQKIVQRISLGSLFILDELEMQRTLDLEGNEIQSAVRCRYHLGAEMHDWLCGEHPQYALLSGKLLKYHPDRQKYHILLGFCLAYYSKVNERKGKDRLKIKLTSLLDLAAIQIPNANIDRFRQMIQRALQELAEDGVIPGLQVFAPSTPERRPDKPGATPSTRQIIAQTEVEFPVIKHPLPQTLMTLLPS